MKSILKEQYTDEELCEDTNKSKMFMKNDFFEGL